MKFGKFSFSSRSRRKCLPSRKKIKSTLSSTRWPPKISSSKSIMCSKKITDSKKWWM